MSEILKFSPSVMSETNQNLIRELSPREKRRFVVYGTLPVDAVDPLCSTRELVENHQTKLLYRYGCGLEEMMLEIEAAEIVKEQNFITKLRGLN